MPGGTDAALLRVSIGDVFSAISVLEPPDPADSAYTILCIEGERRAMTDKELQKLGRRELLQMLLEQAKEAERLGALLKESEEKYRELEDNYERLRGRLDKKDAQIHNLRATLQTEREKREMDMENVGSIAEAALRLNGVFEAAQRAANQYLQSVRELYPAPEGMEVPPMALSQEDVEAAAAAPPPVPVQAESAPAEKPEPEKRPAAPKRSLRLKKQQEKGKLTLFFGWQHD